MVAALFSPMVLGIWWKRANVQGAIAGILVGGSSFIIAFSFFEMPYNSEILIGLPLSIVSMVVVSLVTESPSEEIIKKMEQYHLHEADDRGSQKTLENVT
ncbi:hypothetical protein NSA56_00845 [Oceanobacillus caeni]|uniref:hypothetical protein n=1 Tax=Oceanobacillus TaxID=182709 RepID=UPI000621FADF|nr:hypothetical protein [Oceanobacillus caeni]KKE79791.1 hypothetical protein WH51_06905 [Bacilli bacterium VT-13-104]PZD89494.1 hypothetical protein DEJ64_00110 [Bacilli bacterium]MBU8789273.1 hypothetical protein [Oceanobacillus caeni]MCR1832942.1 hypothetical protein [Oceanobacillus caeni]PZD91016.1 hypothetical protein DEJ60_00110 [Bacilli bacterium]